MSVKKDQVTNNTVTDKEFVYSSSDDSDSELESVNADPVVERRYPLRDREQRHIEGGISWDVIGNRI